MFTVNVPTSYGPSVNATIWRITGMPSIDWVNMQVTFVVQGWADINAYNSNASPLLQFQPTIPAQNVIGAMASGFNETNLDAVVIASQTQFTGATEYVSQASS